MNKYLFAFIIIIINSYACFSQGKFEKAYFIDNDGQRTECLVKNENWVQNPEQFIYKLEHDSTEQTGLRRKIIEFGVYNSVVYKRFGVEIDMSPIKSEELSTAKDPEYSFRTLYLKELVSGKANLYVYDEVNLRKFFYSIDGSNVKQLVFKNYINSTGGISVNRQYREEIWIYLDCENLSKNKAEKLKYNSEDLIEYFTEYNQCKKYGAGNFNKIDDRSRNGKFNLNLFVGAENTVLSIQDGYAKEVVDFENKLSYLLGFEMEFALPTLENNLFITVEPSYYIFKNFAQEKYVSIDVNYQAIRFASTLKYYYYNGPKLRSYIKGGYALFTPVNGGIYEKPKRKIDLKINGDFCAGLGRAIAFKISIFFL